jgi:hypothetical protein
MEHLNNKYVIIYIFPDPATNSETTNLNFQEFIDQLRTSFSYLVRLLFVNVTSSKTILFVKIRIFRFENDCWIQCEQNIIQLNIYKTEL